MEILKQWSRAVCCIAIALSILEMLLPSGNLEKIMRLIIGSFMIITLVLPFKNLVLSINEKISFHKNDSPSINFNQKIKEQAIKNIEERLKNIVESQLREKKVNIKKINIFMDMKDDNCISIEKIQIYLSLKDKGREYDIKDFLEKKLGMFVEILIGDE